MLMFYAAVIDDAEDMKRFEKIYYTYRKQMLFAANRILHDSHEAEDAVQNALLGIARNIHSLPNDDARVVRAYTLTAAKNAALNMLPEKQRRDEMLDINDTEISDMIGCESAFAYIEQSEDRELIAHAIDRLPDIYKDVLLLHCVCGLKIGQTADVLGRKKTTVDKQISRARKLLVRFCAEEGMVFEHAENKVSV